MGLGHVRSWLCPAPAAPWPGKRWLLAGQGAQGSSWGSTRGQTLQETNLTGSQEPLHHCLSLFIPSCLLSTAQLTWHSGKPNLIFWLREPSDLHHFQTDFIKESSMPSCRLEETQTFAKLWLRNREEKEHRSSSGYSTWLRVWPGMSHQVPWVAQGAAPPLHSGHRGMFTPLQNAECTSDGGVEVLGPLWWTGSVRKERQEWPSLWGYKRDGQTRWRDP